MTDFIYIDGVEYKPDKELIDLIKGYANNSLSNNFERKAKGDYYYLIENNGIVYRVAERNSFLDDTRYEVGNYCTNEELLKKRAAEETLLNSKGEPTGRYKYEVKINDSTTFKEVTDNYKIIDNRGEIWMLEDKDD